MMNKRIWYTADLIDIAPDSPTCETQFQQFGGVSFFEGQVRTLRCFQDNGLVKETLNQDGEGCVLIVDGEASLYSALVGDMIASAAHHNNWAGIIINGVVRDSLELKQIPIGIKALGTNPKKSSKTGSGERACPVAFGNVVFHEGDYVYSDEDGIIVVSKPIVMKES